eukprot:superscaffoldBa00000459_g4882
MEELKERGRKREGRHRDTWDPFQLNPIGAEKEAKRRCFQLAQYLVAVIVGLAVLTSAVISKGSLLVLTTMSSPSSMRSPKEKQFYMLMLVFCLVWPNFLVFMKSLWRCAFKSFVHPNMNTMLFIFAIECLVSLGTSVLVLVVMPQFDVLTNLFITGGVCIVLSELDGFRDFVFVISSILRILVIGGVYLIYQVLIQKSVVWQDFNLQGNDWELLQIGLVLFFLQALCSAACHWFGVVACKIHAVRMSFALPVCCTGPFVLLLGLVLFAAQAKELGDTSHESIKELCGNLVQLSHKNTTPVVLLEITRSICRTSLNSHYLQWPFAMLGLEGMCMWSGFITCTYYVWKIKVQRIERTSQLFVRRLYESAFIDLSLLLNTKMKVPRAKNQDSQDDIQSCVIYLCATMWHETYDEMLKILTSMFRLDRYRGDPKEDHKDCFDFECHIFVDDAFMTEKETGKRLVNSYVDDLINVVIEVYRLMFVMPEGNMLYVHLKDKGLIRNKKRWSQIMYLYYLLGWKGYIAKNPQKIQRQNNPCRESLISMYGEIYMLPQYDSDNKRRLISDDNTYILALDGDTDFQPKAVILLVDRLRMYDNVGAACGRIHPTGMGPMVWYQKFEYAVGHWLQKTAEHVFGSVLCSPGCFSLFRGSALMDDNVMKRYTTTATRASEYVQYDQGEDRWLCTLLLQQGWRVEYNAASDAYTNSPQEFKEFYNQRRRWGPSTLANTLDLLHSGAETVKRNTSISRLYIFYQMFTVGSSILGPASVTLMIAGAFQFVFKMTGTLSIIVASIPPVFYIIVCFVAKPNNQITIAGIMSVLYAFLMTASFFSIIGDMVIQGTFLTPTGLFLVSMAIMYLVTALLHPEEFGMIIYGLMYFICIPSGYLLLTIYSLVNMHIVSWGTRESNKGDGEVKKNHNALCDKSCKICCWDMKIQITQETESLIVQQITGPIAQQAPPLPITNQETTEQAASNPEPKARLDTTTEEAEDRANKPPTDENKGREERSSDLASNGSIDSAEKRSISPSISDDDYDEDDDDNMISNLEETEELPLSDWVTPVKEEFLKKLTCSNMKRNLQEQIRYALRNKAEDDVCEELVIMLTDTLNGALSEVGPEDVLTQSQLEELEDALTEHARRILKTSHVERLEKRVKVAIHKTLTAPQVPKLDEAVFLYFIINVLWVVATFFLQAIGNDVISIKIPKFYPNGTESGEYLKVEPLSLMFLLSFAVLLIVQFLAMLYHRIYTLIHVVSYRSTEKDYKQRDDDDDDDEGLTLGNPAARGLSITSEDL